MAQLPTTQRSQSGQMTARREHPLVRLQRDFDSLFNSLWGGRLAPADQDFATMRVWDFDVTENDQEIVVRAELPGFEPNELDVQINNDMLTIKAEEEKKDNGHEEYRSFYRTVALPGPINAEKVQASYRNGVLELHLPRAEGSRPRRIQIQADQGAGRQTQPNVSSSQAGSEATQAGKQARPVNNQSATPAPDKAKK